jgi:hypothetical protein
MAKCNVKRIRFVLTRDMVPIHYSVRDNNYSATFICPLPQGYVEILKKIPGQKLFDAVAEFVKEVNDKAERLEEPFQNILLGYEDRDEDEKNSLLKNNFKIRDWNFDQRGLYVVSIHAAEGDAYLSNTESMKCDFCIYDLAEKYLDHEYAFYCHNMDYYWQALMVREVLIKYFNFLVLTSSEC